jgi:putative ABC transport system permease protein
VWRITYASARAHTRRLISTSLAVLLGVALLAGTMILGDTMRSSFDRLFQSSLGRADAVVRSATDLDTDGEFAQGLIDGRLAGELEQHPAVAAVAPQIEGFGQLSGADGEKLGGNGPPTLAGSWIDDPSLNPYQLVEGRAPEAPDEVVVNRGAADDGHLRIGDVAMVATPEPVEVEIVGIATFGGEDGMGPSTFTGFSLAGAEEHITGRPGEVTSLLVRGADGMSEDELVAAIAPSLPVGAEVVSGDDLVAEANEAIDADFLGFLRAFLLVFAGVALLVATFSIANTFSILVAQRVRAFALLRAVGASRRQVLVSMIGETLLVGVIASVAGLVAGIGLAQGLKALFDAFGFALPAGGLTITATTVIVAPLVGILVTVLAGLVPALRSSRVAPLAALRDVDADPAATSRRRLAAGLVCVAAGVGTLLGAVASGDSLALAGLGALLTAVGTVVLGPVAAQPAGAVLGAPLSRLLGLPGALARRNVVRSPRRTAATASALMLGIGVVTMFTAFAGSLKSSLGDSVDTVVQGDLMIASSQFGGGGLSPGLTPALARLDEVERAVGVASGPVAVDDRTMQVSVLDPAATDGLVEPPMVVGDLATLRAGEIAVAESKADDRGWSIGEQLPVRFPDGQVERMTIGAVYDDVVVLQDAVVPREVWLRHSVQTIDNLVAVGLADGVALETGRTAVEAAAAPYAAPDVQTRQEFVDESTATIDGMLGLVYVMLALAVVIALMGIANTLSLSIHERVRELGLLRAVGATQAQLRATVRWESVLIAVFGTIGGLLLGVFLGWALVASASAALASLSYSVPVGQLVPIAVVGALAGVLASIRPARRAARTNVIEAVATTG